MPFAVVTVDPTGRILDLTPDACAVLVHQSAEVTGAVLADVIGPDWPRPDGVDPLAECLAEAADAGRTLRRALPVRRGDGEEFAAELAVTRLSVGGEPTFLVSIRPSPSTAPGAPGIERRQSEWFHRALVARSPVAILVFEPDGRWRWSSPAAARLHHFVPPEPGQLGAAVHPDDLPILQELYYAAANATTEPVTGRKKGGGRKKEEPTGPPSSAAAKRALVTGFDADLPTPVEVRVRDANGAWRAYAVTAQNLVAEPAVGGIAVYATDITRALDAEHRALVHTARIDTLVAALRVGILVEDEQHHIVLANEALTEILGLDVSPEELVDKSVDDLLVTETLFADPQAVLAENERLMAAQNAASGQEHGLANGRVVARDYAPIRVDEAAIGHLWVLRDVTAEATIRRGLEERNRALAELAELKTEFVAAASHELRTPLTSILTFSQMLHEEEDVPAEQRQVALGAIARNAARTLRIVDDLLTLAGLEGGTLPLTLRAVHIPVLVREAVDAYADAAVRAGVTVAVNDGPTGPILRVDPHRFRQAIEALLGVVSAAHPAGSRIDVAVGFHPPYWIVRVGSRTTSAGDHLFTTGDTGASNALSFLIARAIVSRHGGQLDTPSGSGGNAFVIRLPLRPDRQATGQPTPPAS